MDEHTDTDTDTDGLDSQLTALRREVNVLRAHLRRVDADVKSIRPLVDSVRALSIWDFTPYGVSPGRDWVAIDRTQAEELLATLAGIDHWTPWQTRLEPRPQ